jgi:hypothetical protein
MSQNYYSSLLPLLPLPKIIRIIILIIKDDDDGGEGGDSLLDYNDTEEKDSLLDNESISGSNPWGSRLVLVLLFIVFFWLCLYIF